MSHDFELVRVVLLSLHAAERSPPEPIFIDIPGLATRFNGSESNIVDSLLLLQESEFIEGPGFYDADHYIFRKLTRKGKVLVAALRDPKDWEAAKTLYLPSAAIDDGE